MTDPPTFESPRLARAQPHVHSGLTQTQARISIRQDLETNVVRCPIEAWFNAYTPSRLLWNGEDEVAASFLASVEKTLRDEGVLNSSGWKDIIEARKNGTGEDLTFGTIGPIATAICEAAKNVDKTLSPTTTIHASPQSTTCSEVAGYIFKPDLRAILIQALPDKPILPPDRRRSQRFASKGKATNYVGPGHFSKNTADTAVVAEFKLHKQAKDIEDASDELKIVGAATEIMYNDPRRRFINGFTIEDGDMRLWHFDRGHVGVSEPFKLHLNPKLFIKFILYVLFSTTTELGYDPTVKRHIIRQDGQDVVSYEYEVDGTHYLTQGHPISEDAAFHIVSRATRVWRVKRMEPLPDDKWKLSKEDYVLKDVWLFDDAKLESEILKDVFERLRKVDTENDRATNYAEEAKDYFMNFEEDWRIVLPGLIPDISAGIPEGAQRAFFTGCKPAPAKPQPGAQRDSTLDPLKNAMPPKTPPTALKHHRRIHVRTVFTEVCETIYEIQDFRILLRCLIDIIQALKYLRLAGYVHRDVSGGNCMWYPLIGKAKLSDLEYARLFVELLGHDPRTGTPSFMAVEYQSREHIFVPQPSLTSLMRPHALQPSKVLNFFTFNFYHDLESVFWIYAWFLHHRPPLALGDDHINANRSKVVESAYKWIYCDIEGSRDREKIFSSDHGAVLMGSRLQDLYKEPWTELLLALDVLKDVRKAHQDVQSTQAVVINGRPERWNAKSFTDVPYDALQNRFRSLLDMMSPNGALKECGDIAVTEMILSLRPGSTSKRKTEEVQQEKRVSKKAKDSS